MIEKIIEQYNLESDFREKIFYNFIFEFVINLLNCINFYYYRYLIIFALEFLLLYFYHYIVFNPLYDRTMKYKEKEKLLKIFKRNKMTKLNDLKVFKEYVECKNKKSYLPWKFLAGIFFPLFIDALDHIENIAEYQNRFYLIIIVFYAFIFISFLQYFIDIILKKDYRLYDKLIDLTNDIYFEKYEKNKFFKNKILNILNSLFVSKIGK